jgi:hypothetical protein
MECKGTIFFWVTNLSKIIYPLYYFLFFNLACKSQVRTFIKKFDTLL